MNLTEAELNSIFNELIRKARDIVNQEIKTEKEFVSKKIDELKQGKKVRL